MSETFSISSKRLLITGASRGIGLNLCNKLSEYSASIIGVSRSIRPHTLAKEVEYVQCDVTNTEQIFALIKHLELQSKPLDGLINVAGVSLPPESELNADISRFKKTVETNLTAIYILTQQLLNLFEKSGGSIINFSSINAVQGFPDNPGYVASKSGLSGLTRAMAIDYAKKDIRVNSIAPGYFYTAMTEASFNNPEKKQSRSNKTILGRWGDVDDLVGPVVFLISDMSKYITGTELLVDGGWTAKGL